MNPTSPMSGRQCAPCLPTPVSMVFLAALMAAALACASSASSSPPASPASPSSPSPSPPASPSSPSPSSPAGPAGPAGPPAYAIETVDLGAPQPAMVIRDRVPLTELQTTLTKRMPLLVAHVVASQMQMAAPPYVRYLRVEGDTVEFEAGVPVVKAGAGSGDIQPGELPGGPAVVTVHVGAYEDLFAAHDALRQWAEEHGLTSAGPPWNIFLDNPLVEPDPKKRRTKVVMPTSAQK